MQNKYSTNHAEVYALFVKIHHINRTPETFVINFCIRSIGCSNPIWGLTKNPHNKDRTPGGSSGGEGALVSALGSPFGIPLAFLYNSN